METIKANEFEQPLRDADLRLYNLVYGCTYVWDNEKNEKIYSPRNIVAVGRLPLNAENPHEEAFGIPLSPEWLERCGFEENYKSQFRLKYDHETRFEIGFDFSYTEEKSMEGFRFYGNYIKIQYLHQLQNLYFALTNTELEIKPA